jgi:predicted homoserine dehydrogenase-like protein
MFNSFLDGTKSAIEMAAVANASALDAAPGGLVFPPAGVDELPNVLRPSSEGGSLAKKGIVEVVSSLNRDGSEVYRHMRWGTFVVVEAPDEYVARGFLEYGFLTDDTGRYAAMYRPFHLIGLEAGISIASAALRHEPTGNPREFRADAVAVAKRDLEPGDLLDGEGGYTVRGVLMPAEESLARGAVPIGLAHRVKVTKPLRRDELLTYDAIEIDPSAQAVQVRREMEAAFRVPVRA